MRIKQSEIPDATQPQFPILEGMSHHLPEYWLSVLSTRKAFLLEILTEVGMEYKDFYIKGGDSKECRVVARFSEPKPPESAANVMNYICHKARIESYEISDGGITSVDQHGDIIGFICFD